MGRRTISAIGERRGAGFTLLEILLALAVIGLIATVLIGGSARLLASKPLTPDQVFWSAVERARKTALEHDATVRMTFDGKAKAFLLDEGQNTRTVPVPAPRPDLEVDFLPGDTGANSFLGSIENQKLPSVSFYGDGTCTPFRLQLRTAVGSRQLKIDPWTCAQVLTPLNPDGTPAPVR